MDVVKLFRDMGGADAILHGLKQAGVKITAKGVEKWRERQSLPMSRWMQLVDLHKAMTGKRLTLGRYTLQPKAAKKEPKCKA